MGNLLHNLYKQWVINYIMDDYSATQLALLRKMWNDKVIGGKHHGERELCRGFPKEHKAGIEKELKGLIKKGFILPKSTNYGKQYSLNPKALKEIREAIGD